MEESKKKIIGEEIYKQRVLKGYTQDKLGEVLGYSKQTISAWENGRLTPTEEAFENIKSLFHVDPRISSKRDMEGKEMYLSIKPLEELNTEKDIESAIDQILAVISVQGDNQFVLKYILKRLLFVSAAEAFSYRKISIMHNHEEIINRSWSDIITELWGELLIYNCYKEDSAKHISSAGILREKLYDKREFLRYGCQGPLDEWWMDRTFEEQEEKIPLKGEDRAIVNRGYVSLEDLMSVLPSEDNSIITSVLVYMNVIYSLF